MWRLFFELVDLNEMLHRVCGASRVSIMEHGALCVTRGADMHNTSGIVDQSNESHTGTSSKVSLPVPPALLFSFFLFHEGTPGAHSECTPEEPTTTTPEPKNHMM